VNHNAKAYTIHCFACDYHDFESKGILSLEERKRIQDLNTEALRAVRDIKLPEDITYEPTEFSREARMWLFKGGLTPSVWKQYRIGYSKRLERVVLPVYDTNNTLIWFQCRAVLKGQSPKYLQPSRDRSNVLFTAGIATDRARAIVVEDIMSAIRVGEATTTELAVSLLGTKITEGQAAYLGQFERCTSWLDGDKAGRRGSNNIRKTLSLLTECDNIRTTEDPKFYSNKQIQEILA
tara:strand:+ start:537 stop:1244 length:708 start_codon:yes stop_codon:yes gene_type:complete